VLTLGCSDDTTPKDAVFTITPSTGAFSIELTGSTGAGGCAVDAASYAGAALTYSNGVMTMLGNDLTGTWA